MFNCTTWFNPQDLQSLWGDTSSTAELARDWLLQGGKRLRPRLLTTLYEQLGGREEVVIKPLAIAIECFHKASLIHDDIEDEDALRDGLPTLHEQCGVAVAINVGDYLVAQGYRLLLNLPLAPDLRLRIVELAQEAHQKLTLGQGEELDLIRRKGCFDEATVLRIHERKTAAAFTAAVLMGATAAGASDAVLSNLRIFATAAGVAYQLVDDLRDQRLQASDRVASRPTLYHLPTPPRDRELLTHYLQQAQSALEVLPSSLQTHLSQLLNQMIPADAIIRMSHD